MLRERKEQYWLLGERSPVNYNTQQSLGWDM
jgi:hypothetical protein